MHKSTDLREALQDYLDSDIPTEEFMVEHDGGEISLDWLLGQLWTCSDIVPAGYCEQVDLPHASSRFDLRPGRSEDQGATDLYL